MHSAPTQKVSKDQQYQQRQVATGAPATAATCNSRLPLMCNTDLQKKKHVNAVRYISVADNVHSQRQQPVKAVDGYLQLGTRDA